MRLVRNGAILNVPASTLQESFSLIEWGGSMGSRPARVSPMSDLVANPASVRPRPEDSPVVQGGFGDSVHRRITVAGSGGVVATVVVIAQRGWVRVSIMPPFTWEAIMEPPKVDEVIHALALAREDAKKMTTARENT